MVSIQKKCRGTTFHFKAIKQFLNRINNPAFRSHKPLISSATSSSSVRLSDLPHPIVAGLISVIVNYGSTFILVFQTAKIAGLSPALTASWVWSISIGVGGGGAHPELDCP